jgi:hypothetical protein
MRRALILILVACLCCAPAALAQSNPFAPLPPITPVPTSVDSAPLPPVATTTTTAQGQSDISRGVLFAVAGVIAAAFLTIGVYVSRDARRSLTESDRRALDRDRELLGQPRTPEQHAQARRAKEKARAKGRRQRQARKAGRKR